MFGRRTKRRSKSRKLTVDHTRLVLEALEPRRLLTTTQPFDHDTNPDGYIELGGALRFQLDEFSPDWETTATQGIYSTDAITNVGVVPSGAVPFIPLVQIWDGLAVNASAAEFQFLVSGGPAGGHAFMNYAPKFEDPEYSNDLFAFQQDSVWIDAADVIGDGGVDFSGSTALDPTYGALDLTPTTNSIKPTWFQIDGTDPVDPLLRLKGSVSVSVPSKTPIGKAANWIIEKLGVNFGTNTVYTVVADKNKDVSIEKEDDGSGGWVSLETKEFKFNSWSAQVQQAALSYEDGAWSIWGDVMLNWGSGENKLFVAIGTSPDDPGITIQDSELTHFSASIGYNKYGENEASGLLAGGSTFTISDAGMTYDSLQETFGIHGAVSWRLGTEEAFNVVLGTATDPGIVFRDGELFHFDASASSGEIGVKALTVELHDIHFGYDRYFYEDHAPAAPSPPGPVVANDGPSLAPISDQYYHPFDTTQTLTARVDGASDYDALTFVVTSSDEQWLGNDAFTVTPTGNEGVFDLTIDADPSRDGAQAPDRTGSATVTVTVHDGDQEASQEFQFVAGEEQITYSGVAFLSLGNGPRFEIGVPEESPWAWRKIGGDWDWDVGSLVIGVNGRFGLGPLAIEAKNLEIKYTESPGETMWTVSGGASFPALWNATVVFGNVANPGLVIENGDWQVHDLKVSLSNTRSTAWGLERLEVHYSQDEYDAVDLDISGALAFPGGFAVGAGFHLRDNELEMIELDYQVTTGEGIPIGDTGVFITAMQAELEDIYSSDITVEGSISFATGPTWEIDGKRVGFLTGTGTFWVNHKGMEIDVDVEFAAGMFGEGTGQLILDWHAHDYSATVDVSLLRGFIDFKAWFELDHHDLVIGGEASVTVPDIIPYIGGTELIEVDFLLKATSDEKFVAAWTKIDLKLFDVWAGVEYDFNERDFSFIGHDEIEKIESDMPDPEDHTYKETYAFDVADTANGASFEAEWDHHDSSVKVYLLPPGWSDPVRITGDMNGHTISEGDKSYVIYAIPDRDTPTSLAFEVRPVGWSPQNDGVRIDAGTYKVSVMSDVEVWPDVTGHYIQPRPTLSLDVLPTGARNTADITYLWQSASPDRSTVDFYYDDDAFGYDGRPLATVTPLTPTPDDYFAQVTSHQTWTPDSLESLQHVPYHVYAVIDDGTGIPLYSAYGAHTIEPDPPVLASVGVARGADADRAGFTILITDEAGNVVQTVDNLPANRSTNSHGEVGFNVPAGAYVVHAVRPSGLYVAQAADGQSVDANGNLYQPLVVTDPHGTMVAPSFTFVKQSQIQGRVLFDVNANDIQDPHDLPLDGWQVYLDANRNGQPDDGEPVSRTNHNGAYAFYLASPAVGQTASYRVRQQDVLPGYEIMAPSGGYHDVMLSTPPNGDAPASLGRDFLNAQVTTVSGVVYDDTNGNGQQDPGEAGISGVAVTLHPPEGGSSIIAVTDAQGRYALQTELALADGDYRISVDAPGGASVTWPASREFSFGARGAVWANTESGLTSHDPAYTGLVVYDWTGDGNDDALDIQVMQSQGSPISAITMLIWDAQEGKYKTEAFGSPISKLFVQALPASLEPGHHDLVTVTYDGHIMVWRIKQRSYPDGNWYWEELDDYPWAAPEGRSRVTPADLDHDGDVDLMTNGGLALINDGTGQLTPTAYQIMPDLTIPPHPPVLPVVGDFRGGRQSQEFAYVYADGSGDTIVSTFKQRQPAVVAYDHVQDVVLPGRSPLAVADGDLDGDGDTDLVVATRTGSIVTLEILMSDGGRLDLVDVYEFQGEENLTSLAIADLDGNGYNDIYWCFVGEVDVLLNHGRDYFVLAQRTDFLPGGGSELAGTIPYVATAHLAGRETPLLNVTAVVYGPSVGHSLDESYLSTYATAYTIQHEYETRLAETGAHSGYDFGLHGASVPSHDVISGTVFHDLNENGLQDIGEEGLGDLDVQLVRVSDGGLVSTAITDDLGAYYFDSPGAGDYHVRLANDTHQTSPAIGHLSFGAGQAQPAVTEPVTWATADLNGDGLDDRVLIRNEQIIARLSTESGQVQEVVTDLPGSIHPDDGDHMEGLRFWIQTGDVNADGHVDLVVTSKGWSHSTSWLLVLHGEGDGTFQIAQHANDTDLGVHDADLGMVTPRLGDVDGDGDLDVLWFRELQGSHFVYILGNAGDGTFIKQSRSWYTTGDGHTVAQPADLNGDGVLDLILPQYPPVTAQYSLAFYEGNGLGHFRRHGVAAIDGVLGGVLPGREELDPNGDHSIQVADLDSDGLLDVAVATDESVQILWNMGGFQFQHETLVPRGDLPGIPSSTYIFKGIATVTEDFTNDGLVDLAVIYGFHDVRDTYDTYMMTLLVNEGGGQFSAPLEGITVPGFANRVIFDACDLDGDGDPELVVAPLGRIGLDGDVRTTIWPNEFWQQRYHEVSHTAGASSGGYNFGVVPPASTHAVIRGNVFADRDQDGQWQLTEPGVFGSQVFLDLNADGTHDRAEPWRQTDLLGGYRFGGLGAGRYTVAVETPADYTLTTDTPLVVNAAAGQTTSGVLFGLHPEFTVNDPPVAGFGYCLDLDGVDDYVELSAGAALNGRSDWTFSAWVKPESARWQVVYSEGNPHVTFYVVTSGDGRVHVAAWNAGVDQTNQWVSYETPAGVVAAGEWSFIAVRLSGGDVETGDLAVFVNDDKYTGSLQAEHHVGSHYAVIGANVGALYGGGQGLAPFHGAIDEVRLWDRALADDDIMVHRYKLLTGGELGLTSYWRLDEAEGYLAANGATGGQSIGGDGLVQGHPHWAGSTVPIRYAGPVGFGYCLDLDGVDDYVELSAGAALNGQADWTFSAWVKPESAGSQYIYSEGNPKVTFHVATLSDGSVRVGAWNVDRTDHWVNYATPAGVVPVGEWSFIAVRLSGGGVGTGDLTVFVNDDMYTGTLQAEYYVGSHYAVIGANVGHLHGGGQPLYPFHGAIDEVRLWDRALADDDILVQRHTALTGGEDGLTSYWRFDQTTGGVTYNAATGDASIGGVGTVYGNAHWVASDVIAAVNGTLFGADPNEEDVLHFVLAGDATHGHVVLSATTADFTYTPVDPNWTGTDTFSVFAHDGHSFSALPATVDVVVRQNQPPVVHGENFKIITRDYGGSKTFHPLANDSDSHYGQPGENNLPLAIYDFTQPGRGSVSFDATDQTFTYHAVLRAGYSTTFSYRVVDSLGAVSDWARVSVSVIYIPDPFGSGDQCTFYDADGSRIQMMIKDGTAELHFTGDDIAWERKGKRLTVTGENLQLAGIELGETDERTTLHVHAGGGEDGLVVVGGITGGTIGTIEARDAVLGDDGLYLTGSLGRAHFHDVLGSIQVEGEVGEIMTHGSGGGTAQIGGLGNDLLVGGNGRHMLAGEQGADWLLGNIHDDLALAAYATFDDDLQHRMDRRLRDVHEVAISSFLKEWTLVRDYHPEPASERDLSTRVSNRANHPQQTNTRQNGEYHLIAASSDRPGHAVSVFDDGDFDVLTGSSGMDWFFPYPDDEDSNRITELKDEVFATDMDPILAE